MDLPYCKNIKRRLQEAVHLRLSTRKRINPTLFNIDALDHVRCGSSIDMPLVASGATKNRTRDEPLTY